MNLLAITDDQNSVQKLASIIFKITDIVDFIHIREKTKSIRELSILLRLLQKGGVDKKKIVIHDRLDLALLADIPNVHLPGQGLPIEMVKDKFPFMRIGCSVHSLEEARAAERGGANYVLYGHVYETESKAGLVPRGLKELQIIKNELPIPVYAIGGITPEKIVAIEETETDGIAVMSGIFSAENPEEAAERYSIMCKEGTNEKIL